MTKRTLGIIFLVISGLNIFGWFVRSSKGESIGSPLYIVLMVMMLFGGMALVSSKKKTDEINDIQKRDEE